MAESSLPSTRSALTAALTALAALALTAPAAAPAARAAGPSGEVRRDARARLEPQLALGDDGFARLQAFLDHERDFHALARRHGALFDGLIVLDHEDGLAVLARLHRLRRHDDRLRDHGQAQSYTRELSWPQPAIWIV